MISFSFFLTRTGQIFLLSDEKDFLYDKAKVISQYSERTYPSQQSREIIVEMFDLAKQHSDYLEFVKDKPDYILNQTFMIHSEEVFSKNYTYALKIDNILPDYINKIIFMLNFFNSFLLPGGVNWNCHGLALLISGAFPTPIHSYTSDDKLYELQQITLDELSPGDIVKFGKYDHSIVYLDKDICFSCNGIRAPLQIHSLDDVLKLYGVDSLYNSENICYRKTKKLSFSDKLIGLVSRKTELCTEMIQLQFFNNCVDEKLKNNYYDELSATLAGIYAECYQDDSESNINIRHSFFLIQKDLSYVDWSKANIINNMHRLARAKRMGLVSYQDSINVLNRSSDELNAYTTVLKKQLELEKSTRDKLAKPFTQFLEELCNELNKIKSADESNAQYLDSVYNKMNTIFNLYLREELSTREFSTQIHHEIHNGNVNFRSILQCHVSFSVWSLLDNILWLIDPYQWATGKRLSFFKFYQPISLTIVENIEQCLGENFQEYASQCQDLSDKNFHKNPDELAFQQPGLINVVEMHDSPFIQIQNITLLQVSAYVLIAVLAIIFCQPFKSYDSSVSVPKFL